MNQLKQSGPRAPAVHGIVIATVVLATTLVAGAGLQVASAAAAAQPWAESGPVTSLPAVGVRQAGPTTSGPPSAGLELTGLAAGDRLIVSGPASLALDTRAPGWLTRAVGQVDGVLRWEADAGRQGSAELPLALMDLPLDEPVLVGVERILPDGSRLQAVRTVTRRSDGTTVLGPQTETRIRRMVRLTPAAAFQTAPGLRLDTEGRLTVAANDPRLADLAAEASLI